MTTPRSVAADIYDTRHDGQADVKAADQSINRGYGTYIERALRVLIHEGEDFTSESVRTYAANLAHGEGRDFRPAPNLIPAYIGGYAAGRRPRIVEVGRVTSTRPERRGSKISLWRPIPRTSAATP